MEKFISFIMVLFLVIGMGSSDLVQKKISSELVSDGLNHVNHSPNSLLNPTTSYVTCEPLYGVLPCAKNLWGQLLLVLLYNYLLYLGNNYVAVGSEIILSQLGPGIVGASAFRILGALPGATLAFASGVFGSKETAQAQVVSGVRIFVGSTVLLLSLLWGICIVAGRVDLSVTLKLFDTKAEKSMKFLGSGLTTDLETRYVARIMTMSTIPFIIVQLSHVFGTSSGGRVAQLIALIVSLTFLCLFIFYQVFEPDIQNRGLEYVMHKFVQNKLLQKLVSNDGEPDVPSIKKLFQTMDQNGDANITSDELKRLILGIQFVFVMEEDFVELVLNEIDASGDGQIHEKEFVEGISKWLIDSKKSKDTKIKQRQKLCYDSSKETGTGQNLLSNQENQNAHFVKNIFWKYLKAASLLLLGTSIIAVFSTPLIKSVVGFSSAANIPSMFISYTMVPIAVNYRRAISAITSIRQKKQKSASLTLSEIYAAVFMNNIIGMSVFLGIVYARGLDWDFSAEVVYEKEFGIADKLHYKKV
ncbi:hypothetical protein IFM89_022637 [Coptis chinensis]|uniref:EF-hand domain-containing protein n=1 Tax=Coptis chinensis TaxID=261450 RepID=A0A835GXH6_9MAGN|nr:hypothetical protein IFM89_022637 [Coptis chinensis]